MDISNFIHIGIKASRLELIQDLIDDNNVSGLILNIKNEFGVDFSIIDNTSEFEYSDKFLKANNLEDENPFFRIFDIMPFGKQIVFEPHDLNNLELVEPLMLMLTQRISRILNTECILFFKNLWIPIAHFNSGILHESFDSYNKGFFVDKAWCVNHVGLRFTTPP